MKSLLPSSLVGILILAGVSLLAACSNPKTASDLYGDYSADYAVAIEKLSLKKDGTFKQELTIKASGNHDVVSGRWKYDPANGRLDFDANILVPIDGFAKFDPNYKSPKTGVGTGASYPVNATFGYISIGGSDGVLYQKKS